jgi:hypothetical protein
MRLETFIWHSREGYLPDSVELEPFRDDVEGYGYNTYTDEDRFEGEGIVVIKGITTNQLYITWLEFALRCSQIRGADDDHYDYWPSNFSGLIHLGLQLDELRENERCLTICRAIWDDLSFYRWDAANETRATARASFESEILPRP